MSWKWASRFWELIKLQAQFFKSYALIYEAFPIIYVGLQICTCICRPVNKRLVEGMHTYLIKEIDKKGQTSRVYRLQKSIL